MEYVCHLEDHNFFEIETETNVQDKLYVRKQHFFSIQILPAILLLAAWRCQMAILGVDLIEWMGVGEIPFFDAFSKLPKEIRTPSLLHSSYHLTFIPTSLPEPKHLEKLAFQLATLIFTTTTTSQPMEVKNPNNDYKCASLPPPRKWFHVPFPSLLVLVGLKLYLPGIILKLVNFLAQIIHAALLLIDILSFEGKLSTFETDFPLLSIQSIIPLISAIRLLYDVHMSIYTMPLINRAPEEINENKETISLMDALPPFSMLKKKWEEVSKNRFLSSEYLTSLRTNTQLEEFVEKLCSSAKVLTPLQTISKINLPSLPFSKDSILGSRFPILNIPSLGDVSSKSKYIVPIDPTDDHVDQESKISWFDSISSSSWRNGRKYPLISGLFNKGGAETYRSSIIFQSSDFDALIKAASEAIGYSTSDIMFYLSIFDRTYLNSLSKSHIFKRFLV